MSDYVFTPPDRASLPVEGRTARFPLRRIFCVGRNYAAHAREMGNDDRDPPFFFSKPADAAVPAPIEAAPRLPYPPMTADLHFEIELAVAIGAGGADIATGDAWDHVWGYGVAVDLTRRDLQAEAKRTGRPWDWAKGFDQSAPIAPLRPAQGARPGAGRIWLAVDGEVRQDADLSEMIWPIPDILAHLSQAVALRPGDLVLTGTPAGVGAVTRGQHVTGGAMDLPEIGFTLD
ncbi:FAA hydrolase family protein [Mesobaculum littorinae]|uniref:FAA hydrolase family protein n=1 Tax=Mesobaculum littorinae TaxID=2486419 RepID=A0A438AIH6_9RHOB|nr:fumarylacetoacetate hydrolase family protein [Mesobaculum littorinae]RVV98454.1 FAA hydrolase family protein [Mesobaculum littorinae]